MSHEQNIMEVVIITIRMQMFQHSCLALFTLFKIFHYFRAKNMERIFILGLTLSLVMVGYYCQPPNQEEQEEHGGGHGQQGHHQQGQYDENDEGYPHPNPYQPHSENGGSQHGDNDYSFMDTLQAMNLPFELPEFEDDDWLMDLIWFHGDEGWIHMMYFRQQICSDAVTAADVLEAVTEWAENSENEEIVERMMLYIENMQTLYDNLSEHLADPLIIATLQEMPDILGVLQMIVESSDIWHEWVCSDYFMSDYSIWGDDWNDNWSMFNQVVLSDLTEATEQCAEHLSEDLTCENLVEYLPPNLVDIALELITECAQQIVEDNDCTDMMTNEGVMALFNPSNYPTDSLGAYFNSPQGQMDQAWSEMQYEHGEEGMSSFDGCQHPVWIEEQVLPKS